MDTPTGDWKRLGRYIRQRRERLRITQQDMYAKGGPSVATIRTLEAGEQAAYRNRTYFQIEESLDWAPGSVEAILAGGEPKDRAGASGEDSTGPMVVRQLRMLARAEGKTVGQMLIALGVDAGELEVPEEIPQDPIIAELEADTYLDRAQKDRMIDIYLKRRAELFEAEYRRRQQNRRLPGA